MEAAGRTSLYIYLVFIAACLIGIAMRATFRRHDSGPPLESHTSGESEIDAVRDRPAGRGLARLRMVRFFLEYIGNLSIHEHGFHSQISDRRRNRQTRVLLDRVREEMSRREIPSSDTEELMEELRKTIRTEGQGHPS